MIQQSSLILSATRALLFNIINPVRFISIKIIEDKLVILIYLTRELSEDEKDIYYSVSGEIAGDFPELNDSLSETRFIVTSDKYELIQEMGTLVFARHE